MAIRDKIRKNAQSYLEPGETIQAAFPATRGPSPLLMALLGVLPMLFLLKYVAFVATDRRILVLKTSAFATTKPKEVLETLPRDTKFGPVSGLYAKVEVGGARYRIHRRFHDDVRRADAA